MRRYCEPPRPRGPVNLFHVSSIGTSKAGRLERLNLEAVKGFMALGMVPVLGGDLVYDEAMGFSVCSGDQVAALLARELGATDLVFATDVAGVYDSDPKKNPAAKLIPEVSLSRVTEVLPAASSTGDASGAMRGKIQSLATLTSLVEKGLRVSITSMLRGVD